MARPCPEIQGFPGHASSSPQASVYCASSFFHLTAFSFTCDSCLQSICSAPTASGGSQSVARKASRIPTNSACSGRIQNLGGFPSYHQSQASLSISHSCPSASVCVQVVAPVRNVLTIVLLLIDVLLLLFLNCSYPRLIPSFLV